jgi:predicted lipid-binding transport protein (Tim44 family)
LDLVEKLRDPELLKAMGIGDKLLGTLIVMVLGLAICMMILSIIMLAIKLLRLTSLKKAAPAAVQASPSPVPAPVAPIEDPQRRKTVYDQEYCARPRSAKLVGRGPCGRL